MWACILALETNEQNCLEKSKEDGNCPLLLFLQLLCNKNEHCLGPGLNFLHPLS